MEKQISNYLNAMYTSVTPDKVYNICIILKQLSIHETGHIIVANNKLIIYNKMFELLNKCLDIYNLSLNMFFNFLNIGIEKYHHSYHIDLDKFNTIFKTNLDNFQIWGDHIGQSNTQSSALSTAYVLFKLGFSSDDVIDCLLEYYKSKVEIHDIHIYEYILYKIPQLNDYLAINKTNLCFLVKYPRDNDTVLNYIKLCFNNRVCIDTIMDYVDCKYTVQLEKILLIIINCNITQNEKWFFLKQYIMKYKDNTDDADDLQIIDNMSDYLNNVHKFSLIYEIMLLNVINNFQMKILSSLINKISNARYHQKMFYLLLNKLDIWNNNCDALINTIISKLLQITYHEFKFLCINEVEIMRTCLIDDHLNEEIYNICMDLNFYPKYVFKFVDQKSYTFHKMCTSRHVKITSIKSFSKKNNLVPDEICLENAVIYNLNKNIIKWILSYGPIPTVKCINACKIKHQFVLAAGLLNYHKTITKCTSPTKN